MTTPDHDKAVYDLTVTGRVIVLISVILSSTCYTATILVATTLLIVLVGLAIVVPVLGHATWHLYRKLVEPPTELR